MTSASSEALRAWNSTYKYGFPLVQGLGAAEDTLAVCSEPGPDLDLAGEGGENNTALASEAKENI